MENIRFKPYRDGFEHDSVDYCYELAGVIAYWERRNRFRSVFVDEHRAAKSCRCILDDADWYDGKIVNHPHPYTIFTTDDIWDGEAVVPRLQHIANTLTKWVRNHSEDELNILVRLIKTGAAAPATDAEKALLAEYKFLDEEAK